MALELHNFVWEGERLVQVETQPIEEIEVISPSGRQIITLK
ncbi:MULTISPECIES: hypothetical protein [unclassified Nostoc]|nr:hypothetical protein [Nostoc sp. S13]MDF5735011.1 hypothetical protein [Nostoc sp. S13]